MASANTGHAAADVRKERSSGVVSSLLEGSEAATLMMVYVGQQSRDCCTDY